MRTGRPSDYSDELAADILDRIAAGQSLRGICFMEGMPCQTTVYRWLREKPDFQQNYARARELQADTLFDEILSIADTPVEGERVKKGDDGATEIVREDMLGHRRLQIDARKWMAGKLRPKVYGDKHLIGSDPDNPLPETKIDLTGLSVDALRELAKLAPDD